MNNIIFDQIISFPHPSPKEGEIIGYSRKGLPIKGFKFGHGPVSISLIGGCHADEPVGPRFLRHFVSFFAAQTDSHPSLNQYQWWIIPHANPDGETNNSKWTLDSNGVYNLSSYLSSYIRELPADDMEFGFPVDDLDKGARPENKAIYRWWQKAETSFQLHVSLHGIAFGKGPWFLIDSAWISRCKPLIDNCTDIIKGMGYALHDVNRKGEKGFFRIAPGFSTRSDSKYLKDYFLDLGDKETANIIRPSSMETIRKLSGDVLTLVSNMPLFIVPESKDETEPAHFDLQKWKNRFEIWKNDGNPQRVLEEAQQSGLKPMSVYDQMKMQFYFIDAGIERINSIK